MSEALPVITQVYKLYKHIVDLNSKLPKAQRYSLGQSLEQSTLELMEQLIMAKNAPKPHKPGFLIKALAQQEIATLKLRLYLELKLANETKVFQAQAILKDIGRMAGGWLKSLTP
ncbi:MAG TPA: four helix bundle protein [Candidatus Saccharimonadales bacterium]|nr:four helix bundle protein [Candidatus Saccharimonadales bacterium]